MCHPPAPNLHLGAGPDGTFMYAFNQQTADITVVPTRDGATIKTIPFGDCEYIRRLPSGKYVVARNRGHVSLISTATHDAVEYGVPAGFKSLFVFRDSPRMPALTAQGLMIWDTEAGTLVGTIRMPEPALLLERSPLAQRQQCRMMQRHAAEKHTVPTESTAQRARTASWWITDDAKVVARRAQW